MIKAIVGTEGDIITKVSVGKEIVEPLLQDKVVEPKLESQIVTFDKGYNGLRQVEITEPTLQEKIVSPTKEKQIVTSDKGYIGLSSVEVDGVTSEIDSNIKPNNILKDVEILGVKGTVEAEIIPDINLYTGNNTLSDTSKEEAEFFVKHMISVGKNNTNANMQNFLMRSQIENFNIYRNIDCSSIKSAYYMFQNCTNLKKVYGVDKINFSNVTDIDRMFTGCSKLEEVDFSIFDLGTKQREVGMYFLFYNCSSLKKILNLDLTYTFDSNVSLNQNNLTELTFKKDSVISKFAEKDISHTINKVSLDKNGIHRMLESLGTNDTGYMREFKISPYVYDVLPTETLSLATEKNYTLTRY
jgi:hypothetical protein